MVKLYNNNYSIKNASPQRNIWKDSRNLVISSISFTSSEEPGVHSLTKEVYNSLSPKENPDHAIAKGDITNRLIVARNQYNEIIGSIAGAIYSNKFCSRKDNWYFGENRDRSCWIEFLVSKQKGLGTVLIEQLHQWFDQHQHLAIRKNYYVTAIPSAYGFYLKMGYEEISTPDHDDDEDYPEVFRSEFDCIHMAKPMNPKEELDNEVIYTEEMGENYANGDYYRMTHWCKRGDPRFVEMIPDIPRLIQDYKKSNGEDSYEVYLFANCVSMFDLPICQKVIFTLSNWLYPNEIYSQTKFANQIKDGEFLHNHWLQFASKNRYKEVPLWLNQVLSY